MHHVSTAQESTAQESTAQESATVARLSGVTQRYGNIEALTGLDLNVQQGEVLALLGPNGAGKTTAISLLLGLLRPDEGQATLFGRDPREPEVRCRMGAMLQDSGIAPTLKVEEQIDLFRSYYPSPAPTRRLVEAAELHELMDRRSNELSGGQLQRVMFALAMAGDPELLFLDEPSAGLDLDSRRRLWAAIRELTAGGRTVLLTTHYLEEAAALADRVAVIHRGRLIAEGTPEQLEAQVSGKLVRCKTSIDPDILRPMDEVSRADRRGSSLEILTPHAESVVRRLLEMDPQLSDLEVSGVGLEQAFLALTGDDPGSASESSHNQREHAA